MIERLSIFNYRSNRRLVIKLDKYITCLVGECYRGKSNAVRALRWVALNRPSGTGFINWNAKCCIVAVTAEGHTVTRIRSKDKNVYRLDGRKMEAFGNDVPASVQKLLNLSDINFQTQQEIPPGSGPLFWFALTPGQVSKRFNSIVNLDVIDRTLTNLQSGKHKTKTALDICRARKEEAKAAVERLAFVEEMAAEWKEITRLVEDSALLDQQTDYLEGLLQDCIHQKLVLEESKTLLEDMGRNLQELEMLRTALLQQERECQELTDLINTIETQQQTCKKAFANVKEAETQYIKTLGRRCPLCGKK